MPILQWGIIGDTAFNALTGDFSQLAIRPSGSNPDFYYFYDTVRSGLVTDFVLDNRPRVETRCTVTLIKAGEGFSPRLRFWKRDKTQPGKAKATEEIENTAATRQVKAAVDTDEARDGFWKLIAFIQSVAAIDLPEGPFRLAPANEAELAAVLQEVDRDDVISAVRSALGGRLTEQDIQVLADRKGQLDEFEKLLNEPGYFAEAHDALRGAVGKVGKERVWQIFFERNPWILGYGLKLVSCDPLDENRLEQVTSGAGIFSGAGKRVDALLKTRGYISSLLFCEFKHHDTELLDGIYRPPDVYQVSKDVSGGVTQVQKTAHKAVAGLRNSIEALVDPDGTPTGIEFSVIRPRQVLVVGNLQKLMVNGRINPEMSSSFELYRRSIHDVEIVTFDELFERAKYIVRDGMAG
ncbi:Shedu immune nuclease family protein [Pseudofrankia sp. BMG5.36]|uniref:Shedu immune nuclease family protein n=1 Tax=Pseudofrankia sp. BMG5.36 TaxID=1834512 RepID=UPI0008DAA005|nr:Shedu immune nuclease family protein [Pseudofrankia sp. BMG5.36]OHV61404.1 hypothetical protein BCD48_39755 [Pseudofrankia sp. BMG5.36]